VGANWPVARAVLCPARPAAPRAWSDGRARPRRVAAKARRQPG